MKVKKYSGHAILFVLALLPIAAWAVQEPLQVRFFNLRSSAISLGQISGLLGMSLFSLSMILSSRIKIIERFFNGINDAYIDHHFMGGIAFCLLLMHPLILLYNYMLISANSAALFLLPSFNKWPQSFGTIGLLIMIFALVITFYMKLKYQVWKFTHKFLGVAFFFASLHVLLIGSDISRSQFLSFYFKLLILLGLAAYLYRSLFSRLFVRKFGYIVKNIASLPDNTMEIEMQPQGKEMQFMPGQFIFISFLSKNISREAHPFSMSSQSGSPLKIAVKELGDYTRGLKNVKIGSLAKIEGPYGSFSFKNYSENQIWIAGGIGIAPFISMMRSFTNKDLRYKIKLYYSAKDEGLLAFKDEINKIAQNNAQIEVIFWPADKNGLITAKAVREAYQDILDCDILICGPSFMMNDLKKQFADSGVKKSRIHSEDFQFQ